MTGDDFKRKLTAVFSADVVGYSRLMGEDETATVKTLETYKGVMFILVEKGGTSISKSVTPFMMILAYSLMDAPVSYKFFSPSCADEACFQ